MNSRKIVGHNHPLHGTIEVVRDNRILQRMGLRKGEGYRVTHKAGMLIRLTDAEGRLTEWIFDPEALEALRPVFHPAERFIPEGCVLFAEKTMRLRLLEGGGGSGISSFPPLALVGSR